MKAIVPALFDKAIEEITKLLQTQSALNQSLLKILDNKFRQYVSEAKLRTESCKSFKSQITVEYKKIMKDGEIF